jgi:hypothetical protein
MTVAATSPIASAGAPASPASSASAATQTLATTTF